ncbi:uncharacterized protein DS421_12g364600 [Arachis hypogaea]|nr:uncharacterized protein DS421_12g364600 [Arachis hypogaea]
MLGVTATFYPKKLIILRFGPKEIIRLALLSIYHGCGPFNFVLPFLIPKLLICLICMYSIMSLGE